MHYYSFNIADYKKDTDYLKPIEHYVYRSLIDRYYLDEMPIPTETQPLLRRFKLETEAEIQALNYVLSEFFTLKDDGYHHARIDAEIEKYQANAEKNRENGKKGGRPPKNKPKITQPVNDGLPVESQINPNQEPLTINQEPITNNQKEELSAAAFSGVYESAINHLMRSGIIPIGKKVNDGQLRPEVYRFVQWCGKNNKNPADQVHSIVSWFQRIEKSEVAKFYTPDAEIKLPPHQQTYVPKYYDPSEHQPIEKMSPEAAARVDAEMKRVRSQFI